MITCDYGVELVMMSKFLMTKILIMISESYIARDFTALFQDANVVFS